MGAIRIKAEERASIWEIDNQTPPFCYHTGIFNEGQSGQSGQGSPPADEKQGGLRASAAQTNVERWKAASFHPTNTAQMI
jgi:hypothetical protein